MEELPMIVVALAIGAILLALANLLRGNGRNEIAALQGRLDALSRAHERVERDLRGDLALGRRESAEAARDQRMEQRDQLSGLGQSLADQLARLAEVQTLQIDSFGQQLAALTQANEARFDMLRRTLDDRLRDLAADTASQLAEIRKTVDEKLQTTLEHRLGESFGLVSRQLESVHRGLGEMQALAAGVGDLKKVLTNVKTRGTWGEVQLATLLAQLLTIDQYQSNVATRPGSSDRVEFAVRMPGRDGEICWLPIDAKFPREDYERLVEAAERADIDAVEAASRGLESRIKDEARKIAAKYIEPPHTTDFALLFLPTEGLYAEILRRPGLSDILQREHRVVVAGPTTLTALLNSLQMGFRTLAVEKRSSEIRDVLGAVKGEFGRFGDVLVRLRNQVATMGKTIESAETRSNAMRRRLRTVEELPGPQAQALLGLNDPADPDGDDATPIAHEPER